MGSPAIGPAQTLILLNGPSGIGKSTLAERYADHYPGTLNLDVDRVRMLIGGWREDFVGAGETVRPIAHAMAHAHLAAGGSVIVPQYLADSQEVSGFEQIATQHGAEFIEVLLFDSREESVRRLQARSSSGQDAAQAELHAVIADVVASPTDPSGRRNAESMYDELMAGVATRSAPIRIHSIDGEVAETLEILIAATSATPSHS
jgi:predicted kinase